jgi:hypothetical protein
MMTDSPYTIKALRLSFAPIMNIFYPIPFLLSIFFSPLPARLIGEFDIALG